MISTVFFFFSKQKTAYEMRISDWSSDVCSSDLSPGSSRRLPTRRGRQPQRIADDDQRTGRHGDRSDQRRDEAEDRQRHSEEVVDDSQREILTHDPHRRAGNARSEERSVGKECVSTCRSRRSTYHEKKKKH